MSDERAVPLVGIPTCLRTHQHHDWYMAGDKYVRAVSEGVGGIPLLIPALGEGLALHELIARLDGLLFTGSPSNIEPHHYDGEPSAPGTLHDPARDATTLPLIRAAVADGLPLLAICRGHQELNVALGGTLHQQVHELPGMMDHRDDEQAPVEIQYGPAHPVRLVAGGLLERLIGQSEITVNSLHGQGIDRLAPGLVAEALAPDGLIEAVRVADSPAFAVSVQWHPEWRYYNNPASLALLAAFGDAVKARAAARRR